MECELRNLSVLIGANGSGKTSILDVLSLLAASAQGKLGEKVSELSGLTAILTAGLAKRLSLGLSLDDVILRSTWNPAKEIHHAELGNLSVGSPADVAVLRLETGHFGFTDIYGARLDGSRKLICELTVRNGKVVYDLNGISRPEWSTLPPDYMAVGDPAWDALNPAPARRGTVTKK